MRLSHAVTGKVGAEQGVVEFPVEAGMMKDGAQSGAVLEFEFKGSKLVFRGVDIEKYPRDLRADAAVFCFQGVLVDARVHAGFDEFESLVKGIRGLEGLSGEQGKPCGLRRVYIRLARGLGGDFDQGEESPIGDGKRRNRRAELPADFVGLGETQAAGSADRGFQGRQGAFLGELGIDRCDGCLALEPCVQRCVFSEAGGKRYEWDDDLKESHQDGPSIMQARKLTRLHLWKNAPDPGRRRAVKNA